MSNDTELAAVCGIDVPRAVLSSFIAGSMLAGVAGVLYGIDLDVSPRMGMNALMLTMVAAVLGGFGSVWNLVATALFLSLSRYWAAWHFGAQWQEAVAFVMLIGVLILRPHGLGRHSPSGRSL